MRVEKKNKIKRVNEASRRRVVSEENMFEYYDKFHVYCLGVVSDETLGPFIFRVITIQPYCLFTARFSLEMPF